MKAFLCLFVFVAAASAWAPSPWGGYGSGLGKGLIGTGLSSPAAGVVGQGAGLTQGLGVWNKGLIGGDLIGAGWAGQGAGWSKGLINSAAEIGYDSGLGWKGDIAVAPIAVAPVAKIITTPIIKVSAPIAYGSGWKSAQGGW